MGNSPDSPVCEGWCGDNRKVRGVEPSEGKEPIVGGDLRTDKVQ